MTVQNSTWSRSIKVPAAVLRFTFVWLVAWCTASSIACDRASTGEQGSSARAAANAERNKKDAAAVKDLFTKYRDAILSKDGKTAVSFVSKDNIQYYEKMRKHALRTPAAEVRAMGLFDKLMVLTLRAKMTAKELAGMDGRKVYIHGVEKGWIGDNVKKMEPSEVIVEGDVARIGLTIGPGKQLPPKAGFRALREGKAWRLDLLSIASLATQGLAAQLKRIDPDVDKALLKVMEIMSGKPQTMALFDPLQPEGEKKDPP